MTNRGDRLLTIHSTVADNHIQSGGIGTDYRDGMTESPITTALFETATAVQNAAYRRVDSQGQFQTCPHIRAARSNATTRAASK